jgi:hypothetical protein
MDISSLNMSNYDGWTTREFPVRRWKDEEENSKSYNFV